MYNTKNFLITVHCKLNNIVIDLIFVKVLTELHLMTYFVEMFESQNRLL